MCTIIQAQTVPCDLECVKLRFWTVSKFPIRGLGKLFTCMRVTREQIRTISMIRMWLKNSAHQISCSFLHTPHVHPCGSTIRNYNPSLSFRTCDETKPLGSDSATKHDRHVAYAAMKSLHLFFPSSLFIHSSSSLMSFLWLSSESSGNVEIVCSNISSSSLSISTLYFG